MSSTLIRGSKTEPVPAQKVSQSNTGWGKVPRSVICDSEISGNAVRVFGYLAMSEHVIRRKTTTVSVGIRLISKDLSLSRNTVMAALQDLIRRGHVTAARVGKQRHMYTLMSKVFEVSASEYHQAPFTNRKVLREWTQGKPA